MTDRVSLALLLAGLLCSATPAWGQAVPAPAPDAEVEAPEALFDQKIGDVGVVLEADGTWTSRLAGGWGQGFSPLGALPGLGYPGLEKGVVFTQVPDFSLTLRLLERYYLELAYHGALEDRSFLLGYDGQPGEPVQWIKAGNASFSVTPRAGQSLADGRRGAPAAGAGFTLGPVDFEILGRYEDGRRETKSFLGYRDQATSTVALDAWLRARFFRLPGPYPLSGVKILVADADGTLGGFREATGNEAAVDVATGEVRLEVSATRRFLVTWNGAPGSFTSSAPLSLPAATDSSPGSSWFVLVQPGSPSAFELRNRYPVSGATGAIVLIDKSSGLPVPGFPVVQAPGQDWFTASGDEVAPFYDTQPGLYPSGSGAPPPDPSVLPWVFRLPTAQAATGLNLGSDVVASSLIVVRNGLPTSAWKYEASTGTLTFDTPLFETDDVQVSLQRTLAEGKATDLVLWQGGRWNLTDGHDLEWNLQGRWNMEQGSFTTEDLQSPGRMAASLAYRGRAGEWSWAVSATGGALLADSTGHRQLFGQQTGGASVSFDGDALRPSAAPGTLNQGSDGVAFSALTLTDANRAHAWFRDYWTYDPLTGTPQVSAWGKPGIERQSGATGGWTGPYLVRGDETRTDRLAVLEIDQAANVWSGLQAYFDKGQPRDLSSTAAVSLKLRVPEGLGAGRVFFQAGTLSEDFDGTAAVRQVEYRSVPTLAFVDQTQGGKRYFAIPEDSSWGNDADKDGAAGEDGTLVTRELTASWAADDGTWKSARLVLTDTERQRLQRTTGWRLVFVPDSATPGNRQTLLAGPVVFEGATWSVRADLGETGTVNPVEQEDSSRTDAHQLRVDWADRESWTVEGLLSPVRASSYRTLAFQVKNVALAAATTFTMTLTDADQRGVTATWQAAGPAASSTWVKARIDLRNKTLSFDGVTVPGATVSITGGTSWDRMTLTKTTAAPDDGTWLISEIEAVDPVWEPVGTSLAKATWTQSQAWPSAALPLVSGVTWDVTSVQSGLTASDWSWQGKTSASGSLGPLRVSGEATILRAAASETTHGAYQTTLPLGWPGGPTVEWTERFSDRGLRSERLALSLPWVGRLEASAQAEGPPSTLDQTYQLGWSSSPQWPAGWSASWAATLSQSRPWSGDLPPFGPQWVDSWGWLEFPTTPSPWSLARTEFKTKSAWSPWSLETAATARVSQSVASTVKWSPAASWELRAPFRPEAEQPWSVTPSVSRRVEAVLEGAPVWFPDEAAWQAATWVLSLPGGLIAAPFAETSEPPLWTGDGLQSGFVESSAGIDWDRSPASDWTDLVVPSAGGAKLVSLAGREGSADYHSAVVSTHLLTRGINLFGALGNTPAFPWYRTDVWGWSATGSWSTGNRPKDQFADVSLATQSDLVLSVQESVGLPVTYRGAWGAAPSQSLGVKPTWSLRHPADLPFELPRWLSPKLFQRQWVQELATSLQLGWQPTPAPVVRDLQVSWKGRLLLSEKSELSLTTKWGQQWQTDLTVVGLEASLDLILAF